MMLDVAVGTSEPGLHQLSVASLKKSGTENPCSKFGFGTVGPYPGTYVQHSFQCLLSVSGAYGLGHMLTQCFYLPHLKQDVSGTQLGGIDCL